MIIELTGVAPTGEAIGRHDGMVVFVPYGLPGEQVEVEIVHRRRNYARGKVQRVIRASPDRVQAPCQYFGRCGGCEWQHVSYTTQLSFKTRAVREQMVRIAKLSEVDVRPCIASPQHYGYRNHMQLVLSPRDKPGYYVAGSKTVIEITECPITDQSLSEFLNPMPGVVAALEESIHAAREAGELDSVVELHLRAGVNTGERMATLEHRDGTHTILAGGPVLHENIGPWRYDISPASFFQVNTPAAEMLVDMVLTALALSGSEKVLELYCGGGLFTMPISSRCSLVLGIESNPSATQDADRNLASQSNVQIMTADVGQALMQEEVRHRTWDVILLDPPRAGVQHNTLERLLHLGATRIVYVSCDPATLARDARVICDGDYRLGYVQPLDMFPQTHHVESVAVFTQAAGGYTR